MSPRRIGVVATLLLWAVSLGVVSLGTLSCTQKAPETATRPSILLVVVDGLRADRAERLDGGALASWLGRQESVSFPRAYAPSSLAEQSLAALFTGRLPTLGGSIGLAEAEPAAEALTLATRLRREGYASAFVSQSPWAGRPGFTRGFDDVQVAPAEGWSSAEIAERVARALEDWQGSAADRPLFLVAHFSAPVIATETSPTEATQEQANAAYDEQLAGTFTAVADLLERVDRVTQLADAVTVLTAGHGYELLEHGGIGSGWTVDEEVVRVPLVVRGAELDPTTRPVSTLDLTATLLDLAGAEPLDDDSALAPRSLVEASGAEARPLLSELVVRERAIARAVIDGELEYVRVLREVPPSDRAVVERGYEELQAAMLSGAISTPPLFGEPVREALYRLGADGHRAEELELAAHVDELSRLRAVLRDYERLCEAEGWMLPQITDRLPVDPSDMEDLEVLGYL